MADIVGHLVMQGDVVHIRLRHAESSLVVTQSDSPIQPMTLADAQLLERVRTQRAHFG